MPNSGNWAAPARWRPTIDTADRHPAAESGVVAVSPLSSRTRENLLVTGGPAVVTVSRPVGGNSPGVRGDLGVHRKSALYQQLCPGRLPSFPFDSGWPQLDSTDVEIGAGMRELPVVVAERGVDLPPLRRLQLQPVR